MFVRYTANLGTLATATCTDYLEDHPCVAAYKLFPTIAYGLLVFSCFSIAKVLESAVTKNINQCFPSLVMYTKRLIDSDIIL